MWSEEASGTSEEHANMHVSAAIAASKAGDEKGSAAFHQSANEHYNKSMNIAHPQGAALIHATAAAKATPPAGSEHGPDISLQRSEYKRQSAEFHKAHPEIKD